MTRIARISSCVAVVLTLIGAIAVPARGETLAREKLPNDIGFELLGKSIGFSFLYQRSVNRYVGLEAGLGAVGVSEDVGTLESPEEVNSTEVMLPLGVRVYAIPQNRTLFVSGGLVFLTNGPTDSGSGSFGDGSFSGVYGYIGPGFEFRSEKGFTFRGTVYGLPTPIGTFIWPGLAVGYAF
jgi:hypothetical protein